MSSPGGITHQLLGVLFVPFMTLQLLNTIVFAPICPYCQVVRRLQVTQTALMYEIFPAVWIGFLLLYLFSVVVDRDFSRVLRAGPYLGSRSPVAAGSVCTPIG